MTEATYQEIWETLSKVDVSKHIEKKNGLSYLSWAWAWGVLMKHYPHAQYEFEQHETHPDGTVTVNCCVQIGSCFRSMWLPVMDYKNNAIKNPDARKISDTKMRCLVKCLAMYGLGHYIYAGEDIVASTSSDMSDLDEGPLVDETPVKQKKVPTKSGGNNIPDESGAEEVVEKLLQFAKKFCTDTNSLRSFWSENKQVIDILDSNFKPQYEKLKAGFTELKSTIEGGNANG